MKPVLTRRSPFFQGFISSVQTAGIQHSSKRLL
jgi:hypothetical protein